jgi:hypothetical protein
MISANNEHKKMYNVYIAAFDHIFKQQISANIEIMALVIVTLFLDNLESLRAYFTLKNEYDPMTIPKIIPINRYSG